MSVYHVYIPKAHDLRNRVAAAVRRLKKQEKKKRKRQPMTQLTQEQRLDFMKDLTTLLNHLQEAEQVEPPPQIAKNLIIHIPPPIKDGIPVHDKLGSGGWDTLIRGCMACLQRAALGLTLHFDGWKRDRKERDKLAGRWSGCSAAELRHALSDVPAGPLGGFLSLQPVRVQFQWQQEDVLHLFPEFQADRGSDLEEEKEGVPDPQTLYFDVMILLRPAAQAERRSVGVYTEQS